MQGVDCLRALGVVVMLDLDDGEYSELLAKFLPSPVWSCPVLQIVCLPVQHPHLCNVLELDNHELAEVHVQLLPSPVWSASSVLQIVLSSVQIYKKQFDTTLAHVGLRAVSCLQNPRSWRTTRKTCVEITVALCCDLSKASHPRCGYVSSLRLCAARVDSC